MTFLDLCISLLMDKFLRQLTSKGNKEIYTYKIRISMTFSNIALKDLN
jgi:hypothetical protein